jgi:hypothetical protein
MAGYGLDIVATTPGVVETVSSTLFDADITVGGAFKVDERWVDTLQQPVINAGSDGTVQILAGDARAFNVRGSMSGIGFNGTNGGSPFMDSRRDAVNDVFLAQHIQLRALPGAGTRETGIVMRVGPNAFSIDNNPQEEPIFFGAGQNRVPNNAIGATDLSAGPHALITVQGGAPARDIIRFNLDSVDPVTHTIAGPNGGTPRNVAVGASNGVVLVQGWSEPFFDVFLDITPTAGNTVETVLASLVAQMANGTPTDGYVAVPSLGSDELGFGIDYDIRLQYPVVPGSDVRFDFDFGDTATVNNVGVPEPSTIVLAALGSVALLGLRRRRK